MQSADDSLCKRIRTTGSPVRLVSAGASRGSVRFMSTEYPGDVPPDEIPENERTGHEPRPSEKTHLPPPLKGPAPDRL